MPKRKSIPTDAGDRVSDYRHVEKRKNIPPAGLAAHGKVAKVPATRYTYDPHLPPILRFDETGQADRLPELLELARQRPLTADETASLAEALRHFQPWLEWAGKREKRWFDVDPVALHIHERISAHAILKLVQREPLQRTLFADPELDYRQAVQFYQHDVDWANRLILGDSLVVMHSLARREDLAGKVQMIYVDPPYGIKFASNFQAQVGRRDVKDKPEDLTREPEQIKAYRDTWTLGVHSYLAYLRDRLMVARELLADSGSIFVQISDENLHRVRMWQEWQVPFDDDPDWPPALRAALKDYRTAWRAKMDEVNDTIAASAPQETLVDQPNPVSSILRVSGPFTVEGVQPAEESLDLETPIGGEPKALTPFPSPAGSGVDEPANAEAYIEKMIRLLRQDGVRFPDNKGLQFRRLDPLPHSLLHAEGEWGPRASTSPSQAGEEVRRVAVAFGPQYGPVTARQVEECLREAYRRGYDDLVFAGFTFDGMAQAVIQEDTHPRVRCHLAHIRPDVNMGDLLKDTPGSQLFTVFGLPRARLKRARSGEWVVEMEGVDIYDPVANTIHATHAGQVAAWFLDSDYDGRTLRHPGVLSRQQRVDTLRVARALKSVVDPERFAAFSSTRSLPFAAGEHRRVAVKVIDPRGNEAMRVMSLEGQAK